MGAQNSKANVSESSFSVVANKTALSGAILPRERVVQNFLLIWVDARIDKSQQDCQNTLTQLRNVVNDINIFTQSDRCIKFLNAVKDEKAFVIVSGSLGEDLVPIIHGLPQLDAIYIFCGNKSRHEIWTQKWKKIKGVYNDIKPICQALQQAAKQCDQDSTAISFATTNEGGSSANSNQLDPSFMYTQIFKEILLEIEYDRKSIKDLAKHCRPLYKNNEEQLKIINEFEYNYRSETPIWWYTRQCFTYQMLNRALRTLECDTIINMGFFIRDLHEQIQELNRKQTSKSYGKSFTVYRGQGLSRSDFEKLLKTKGGLLSFNNFLSTSPEKNAALRFANSALSKTNMIGILFKMSINSSTSSAPFAFVKEVSNHQNEEEVLFSMPTVFRVGEINKIDESPHYKVDLRLTSADDDQQLRTLTERIRMEVVDETGWRRLGQLLLKLNQFNKAEELYNILLEQTSDDSERAHYCHQLGYIKDKQGDYDEAIYYYEKALGILGKNVSPNHPSLAASYNNIGGVYKNMEKYLEALSFYEKALDIYKRSRSANYIDLAISYNNIGSVYNRMEEYSEALLFYEKALDIRQNTLPSNHPSLAISYNNIALVYKNMGKYLKALSFYERALKIFQTALPSNHPDIKTVQENIKRLKEKL
jgi:tetratricopeptide (TPR) repeat protein